MRTARTLELISSAGFFGAENVVLELVREFHRGNRSPLLVAFRNLRHPHLEIVEMAQASELPHALLECRGWFDPGAVRRLRRLIAREQIGIVHSHGAKANLYALAATARCGVGRLTTCHNWTGKGLKARLHNRLHKRLLRYFDAVVAVSDEVAAEALRAGVAPDRLHRIDNGIDLARFTIAPVAREAARAALGLGEAPVVVTVARLSRDKNLALLVRAFAKALASLPGARLVIVGDGPERAALEHEANGLGIAGALVFTGIRRDVPELLAASDLFVLPSLREGLPMGVLEAMASRTPVITTSVGALATLVVPGRTGCLIEPDDEAGLARLIVELLRDPARRATLAEAAHRLVEERYSSRRMGEAYAKLCEAITGEERQQSRRLRA